MSGQGTGTGQGTGSGPGTGGDDGSAAAPTLRIIRGNATPEEVATIVAVLTAVGSEPAQTPEPLAPWSQPEQSFRRPMPTPGPYAWTEAVR